MDISKMDIDTLKKEHDEMVKKHPYGPDRTPEQQDGIDKLYYYYITKSGGAPKDVKRYNYLVSKYSDEYNKVVEGSVEVRIKGDQFVKIHFKLLDDEEWLKKNRNKLALYALLFRCICRKRIENDAYDIFGRYYDNNKLATSITEDTLASKFGYNINPKDGRPDRSSIKRWLRELEADGAIIIEQLPNKNPKLKKKNVYILGEFKGGREYYYWSGTL